MRRLSRTISLGSPFWALLILMPVSASAFTFTPVRPPLCPATTEVNWSYNIGSQGTGEWMVQQDENDISFYANNVDYHLGLVANGWVSQFGAYFLFFDTELNYDFLTFNSGSTVASFTGPYKASPATMGWHDFAFPSPVRKSIEMVFKSDYSVGGGGVSLTPARVCTTRSSSDNTPFEMTPSWRYSGVLLGANDVVYFKVKTASTQTGANCTSAPDVHNTFALWGDPTAGNDFDLFVSCDSLPTPSSKLSSRRAGTQEFMHLTNKDCACGHTFYVAVHSYSGSGWFNLVNHKHLASEHRGGSDWTTECTEPLPAMLQYGKMLTEGYRRYFGANEGSQFFGPIDLYNNNQDHKGTGEIICDTPAHPGRPESDVCCSDFWCSPPRIRTYRSWTQSPGATIAHEMGHHFNCLHDEYEDGYGDECGHSIMADQFYTNTNYCYCNYQPSGHNQCAQGYGDHGWDSVPPNIGRLQTGPAWINLKARTPFNITTTPDQYDYVNFDFNGLYAPLALH